MEISMWIDLYFKLPHSSAAHVAVQLQSCTVQLQSYTVQWNMQTQES